MSGKERRFCDARHAIAAALIAAWAMTPMAAIAAGPAGVSAKFAYCQDCHGANGQGYRGFYPIPRLAGQQIGYVENQLRAFSEHRRKNEIMLNVAHGLHGDMVVALAERFNAARAAPLGGGPHGQAARGKEIFDSGIPEKNVAACAACHGPAASGTGQIPRLAGQLYEYVIAKLVNWSTERGQIASQPDTSLIMEPVAHSLTRTEAQAVAAYVSTLR